MRFIALFGLVLVSLLSSCARKEQASTRPTEAPANEQGGGLLPNSLREDVAAMDFTTASSRLAETARQLDDALALGTPDCPLAHALRDRLCELSAHICALADKDPGAADVRAACKDGGERCDRAKERVSTQCP
jgi:hypothetical protein